MNHKNKTTASQNSAAVINQNSTNQVEETRQISQEIKSYAKSRSACIRRQQWLREEIAKIDAALNDKPARSARRPVQNRQYGELTAALKEVLKSGALSKREIVGRLQAMHLLTEPNPLKVLDSVLYTPHFARAGKVFSLTRPTA